MLSVGVNEEQIKGSKRGKVRTKSNIRTVFNGSPTPHKSAGGL